MIYSQYIVLLARITSTGVTHIWLPILGNFLISFDANQDLQDFSSFILLPTKACIAILKQEQKSEPTTGLSRNNWGKDPA